MNLDSCFFKKVLFFTVFCGLSFNVCSFCLGDSAVHEGEEFMVNHHTAGDQSCANVVSFNNGNFAAFWGSNSQDGSGHGVYGQIFDSSANKIGPEFQVNTYVVDGQHCPRAGVFNNDNFVVSWFSLGQDGSGYGVYGQMFDSYGSEIGNEFQVNTYTTDNQYDHNMGMINNGTSFVVAWCSDGQDGSNYGVYGQIFDNLGNKVENEFQINTYTTNDQRGQNVVGLNNGSFVVAWVSKDQDGSDSGVYCQIFDNLANKIGDEFQVNTYTAGSQGPYSIAAFSNNNFIVVWQSDGQDGSSYGVYGQIFDSSGSKVGNEFRLNTYTLNAQSVARVAVFSNNNFVVAWHSDGQDGSSYGIYGQIFDSSGNKIGGEFQVNPYTSGDQINPYLTTLGSDSFVVVWQSDGQDGDSGGIFGKIFHLNVPPVVTVSSSSLDYEGSDGATVIDSEIEVTDLHGTNFTEAKVSIGGLLSNGENLGFSDQNGILGSYNVTTGELTLMGVSSIENYQTALRSITYTYGGNTDSLDYAAKLISFRVNDGLYDSESVTKTINLVAEDSANDWWKGLVGGSVGILGTTTVAIIGVAVPVTCCLVCSSVAAIAGAVGSTIVYFKVKRHLGNYNRDGADGGELEFGLDNYDFAADND